MEHDKHHRDIGYCFINYHEKETGSVCAALIAVPEVVFFVLTIWTSGFIIVILHRHNESKTFLGRNCLPDPLLSPELPRTSLFL